MFHAVQQRAKPLKRSRPDQPLKLSEVLRHGNEWDLLLPMLYLYRHATELALKASIRACADWLTEVEHRTVFIPRGRHATLEWTLTHTHDLTKLWQLTEDHLKGIPDAAKEIAREIEAAVETHEPVVDLHRVEDFVEQVSQVDSGEAFRYARPNDAQPESPSWYEIKGVEFQAVRDGARVTVESLRWTRWLEPPRHALGVEVALGHVDRSRLHWLKQWAEEHDVEPYISEGHDGSIRYGFIGPLAELWDRHNELEVSGVSISSATVMGAYAPGDPRQKAYDDEAQRKGVTLIWEL